MTTAITQPLTLSARYFSKKELAYVQQTVNTFPNLSLTELAETLCEHLHWVTAKKRNKINACLSALAKLRHLDSDETNLRPFPNFLRMKSAHKLSADRFLDN
ncbi:hypothetical protein [Methyloprofundus sp.]|uniref:hypothetical protein n=1 Tax=Methyloprofundus sp. TaxID=2020875 RepID=UPI003D0D0CFD